MSDGTLHSIATHLVQATAPLDRAFRDPKAFRALMLTLGWDFDELPPSYTAVADAALAAVQALETVGDSPSIEAIVTLAGKAGDVYRAVGGLTEAPAGIDLTAFVAEVPRRLVEYLLIEDLYVEAPRWYTVLASAGVIWTERIPATASRPAYARTHLDWDRIPAVIGDPKTIPALVYGWGTTDFDFLSFAELVSELTNALGVPTTLDRVPTGTATALQSGATSPPVAPIRRALTLVLFDQPVDNTTAEVGVQLAELPPEGATLPGMIAQLLVPNGLADQVDLGNGWAFQLRAGTDLAQQLAVVVRPDDAFVRYPFAPGQPLPSAGFGISLGYTTSSGPALLFGQAGHTRLEIASGQIGLDIDEKAGDLDVKVSATATGFAFVLSASDLDGFLGSLVGAGELRVDVPLGLSWSNRTGLDFTAGAGFAAALYPHLNVGVLRIDRVDLAVRFVAGDGDGATPEVDIQVAVAFSGAIGPVQFSVDRAGAELATRFTDGNAGPFDIGLQTLWPTGLGLAIDAGPVNGGGFVSFDPDRGRYVGLLHLGIFDVAVTAVGILDTLDANGQPLPPPGFSFLLVISTTLPSIPLGFGFTLDGVGGIAALNRRLDAAALVAAVRQGGLDSILFDANPVRDAPTIVSNLSAIFPVAMGRYVFGPMAVIGWGTPTLIHIELAIVVEVPAPVTLALLGQASVVLPDASAPIVSLHIDVIGVYDAGKQTLAVDATLRDSHVAAFALAGDLALRADFSANGTFALAVGGLNPHFTAPPGFPTLKRVSVALGQNDNPRISIEGYLAITSNSRQFGAKAELYAAAGGFSVHGWLSFDALITLHPFAFEFDFAVGMSLNHGSTTIAGVTVNGTLTGPNPFHAYGSASLSLLFFDITVPFDHVFGDRTPLPELPPSDPWPLLHDAIATPSSWTADLPPAARSGVSISTTGLDSSLVLVHPMGAATVREKVLPLNRILDHFGQFAITGPNRFDITGVQIDGQSTDAWTTVTDHFAPGDFENLTETDQLSRDSFEDMVAGVQVGGTAATIADDETKVAAVEYETKIIDTAWKSRELPRFVLPRGIQIAMGGLGAKAGAQTGAGGRSRFARTATRAPAAVLAPQLYTVASDDTLTAHVDIADGVTKGAAWVALAHTAARTGLQVVPEHEAVLP